MSVHDIISHLIMLIGTKIIMRWLFLFMPLLVSNLLPSSRASWDLGILGLYFFLWKLLSDYLTCLIAGTRKRKKVNKRGKTKSVKKIFIQILGVLENIRHLYSLRPYYDKSSEEVCNLSLHVLVKLQKEKNNQREEDSRQQLKFNYLFILQMCFSTSS